MTLAVEEFPHPGAPTLVLIHGFTQNTRCWGSLPNRLQRHVRVLAVDAPGHGRSPAVHDDADLAAAADLVAEVGGRAGYLGYSMGGRIALQLACRHPGLVEQLILVGATPGLADPDARAARRRDDALLADRLEQEGLEAFLERWLALPLFAGLSPEAAARDERLTNRVEGVASSLRRCGTGCQEPLWDRLHRLSMPVLATAGALDTKFAAEARRMVDAIASAGGSPATTVALIDGAGHTAHLEQPDAFVDAVVSWWRDRGLPPI